MSNEVNSQGMTNKENMTFTSLFYSVPPSDIRRTEQKLNFLVGHVWVRIMSLTFIQAKHRLVNL